jgi:general secretion pathway protein A
LFVLFWFPKIACNLKLGLGFVGAKTEMTQQFFNFLGLREDPFHVSPDPRFYFSTSAHESALVELLFGIETRQGFMVLTGEAGTGKTSLLNQIIDWLHRRGRTSAYIFHSHLEPIGLLRFILSDFGVPCESRSKSVLVRALHMWLQKRYVAGDLPVLIIDEAQALPVHTLDELRLLLNLENPRGKMLQIILSGQPELDEKLRLPALRQLRQRVMLHAHLPLLSQKETAAYISSRLAVAGSSDSPLFPDEVVRDIYKNSHGIPRVVNLLCEHALMSAYSERTPIVSQEMVRRVAMDFDLLAKPLCVNDTEFRPQHSRFPRIPVPVPVAEEAPKPSLANQRVTTREWEQIDFDIYKETPAHKDAPEAPQDVPQRETAAVEAQQPVINEYALPAVPPAPVEPLKSWRKRQSRQRLAALARNSVALVKRAWHSFASGTVDYASAARDALISVSEKLRRTVADTHVAVKQAAAKPFAAKKDPTPVSAAAPVISKPSINWKQQQLQIAAFAQNSGSSFQRGWHSLFDPFARYLRSVAHSFLRDCHGLFHSFTPPTPALEAGPPANGTNGKSAIAHALAPLMHWLRQPLAPSNNGNNRSSDTSTHRK